MTPSAFPSLRPADCLAPSSVLLNNVGTGVAGVSSLGYGDAGMNVTFTDLATTTIHQYGGGNTYSSAATGNWLPDYAEGFNSFNGVNSYGNWHLFVADTSGGSVSTVQSLGSQMDIVRCPRWRRGWRRRWRARSAPFG